MTTFDIIGMSSMALGFVLLGAIDLLRAKRWRVLRLVLSVIFVLAIVFGIVGMAIAWLAPDLLPRS